MDCKLRRTGLRWSTASQGERAQSLFFPLTDEQAKAEIEALLHRSPSAYGLNRAGWRLQDVQQALKQEILHLHRLAHRLDELRLQVQSLLDQFKNGSDDLLRYLAYC